jgi:hypothetical protein
MGFLLLGLDRFSGGGGQVSEAFPIFDWTWGKNLIQPMKGIRPSLETNSGQDEK